MNNEIEYEVEEILDKKVRKGKNFYLLKWKGYPDSANSWEPEENLSTCPLLVQQFEEGRNAKKKSAGRKRASPEKQKSESKQEKTEDLIKKAKLSESTNTEKTMEQNGEAKPRKILGFRKNEIGKIEYLVEFDTPSDIPIIGSLTSDYFANNCPMILINYLEQHVSEKKMYQAPNMQRPEYMPPLRMPEFI